MLNIKTGDVIVATGISCIIDQDVEQKWPIYMIVGQKLSSIESFKSVGLVTYTAVAVDISNTRGVLMYKNSKAIAITSNEIVLKIGRSDAMADNYTATVQGMVDNGILSKEAFDDLAKLEDDEIVLPMYTAVMKNDKLRQYFFDVIHRDISKNAAEIIYNGIYNTDKKHLLAKFPDAKWTDIMREIKYLKNKMK